MPYLTFVDSEYPGVVQGCAPYNEKLHALYKHTPGAGVITGERFPGWGYQGGTKRWLLAKEHAKALVPYLLEAGYMVSWGPKKDRPGFIIPGDLAPETLPHQLNALQILQRDRAHMLHWKPGTGKTLVGATLLHETVRHRLGKGLVVVPANVVKVWAEECHKWYNLPVHIVQGTKPILKQPDVTVVSYASLKKISPLWKFDAIIWDEIHYAIHSKTKRTEHCLNISDRNPDAIKLALTGTPYSTDVHNLHGQLSVLYPHRYGSWYEWVNYYHTTDRLGYDGSMQVHGVRLDRAQELSDRLAMVMDVVKDVPGKMPEVERRVHWEPCEPDSYAPRNLKGWVAHQRGKFPRKLAALQSGALGLDPTQQTAYICFARSSAQIISEAIPDVAYVTGDMPVKKRLRTLATSKHVAVTMKSIQEGLDLRQFTQVVLIESYPVPLYLEQVLARFVRLGASAKVTIILLGLRGTCDEILLEQLVHRLNQIATVSTHNDVQAQLMQMLSVDEDSAEFLEDLHTTLFAGGGYTDKLDVEGWNDAQLEIQNAI